MIDFIAEHLDLIVTPSFRFYLKARELKDAEIENWRDRTVEMLNPKRSTEAKLRALLKDGSLQNEAERVAAFTSATGKSQATYYRMRDRVRQFAPML